MIFRIYHEAKGAHVHCRFFSGRHEGALGKCGDFVMRTAEFESFRQLQDATGGLLEFQPEKRDEDGLREEPSRRSPLEQGGVSDRLSNFDAWGDRIRERD
jgi:hypothetical protein